jgi:hypothetical protein
VGCNAGPDETPAWVRLIALLSDRMEFDAAERIDTSLTAVFRGWGKPNLLNEARAKTGSLGRSSAESGLDGPSVAGSNPVAP